LTVAVACLALAATARAGPGDLDPSFDGDGIVTTQFIGGSSARALAQQPDGKLVAVGNTTVGPGNSAWAVARYNADGSLDGTFGTDGRATTILTGGVDIPWDVAIQPNGGIVVAGSADFHRTRSPTTSRWSATSLTAHSTPASGAAEWS